MKLKYNPTENQKDIILLLLSYNGAILLSIMYATHYWLVMPTNQGLWW